MLPMLIPALAPGLSVTEEEGGDACGGSGLVAVAAFAVVAAGVAVGDILVEGVEERAEEEEEEARDIEDEGEGDSAMDDATVEDKVCTAVGLEAPLSRGTSTLKAAPQV